MSFVGVALNCALSLALVPDPPGDADRSPTAVPASVSPTPAPPKLRGTGLIIGTAVTGALGLTANVTRIALVQSACSPGEGDGLEVAEALRECIQDSADDIAFSVVAPLLNLTATGLSTGADVLNARYRAWQATYGRASPKRS